MPNLSCTVSIHKKTIVLFPARLFVYRQCKVIEAANENGSSYYLFFFKDTFLHAVQLDEVPETSFLKRTLSHGLSFSGSHPLTTTLLETNHPLHSTKLSLLFKKAQEKYQPMTIAILLTFFDACMPSETIHKQFKKTFYSFRRNGQLLAAYQLLNIYKDFDPENAFASDMLNNLSFNRYEKRYQNFADLDEQNSAYLELLCFDQLEETKCLNRLVNIYQKENRWIDELAVRREQLRHDNSEENLSAIYSLAAQKLEPRQQTEFLQHLLFSVPGSDLLRGNIFKRLLHQGSAAEVIQFLLQEPVEVDNADLSLITNHFLTAKPAVFLTSVEKLNYLLLHLYREDPQTLEKIVTRCVITMLGDYDLPFIRQWLAPFADDGIPLPIANKLEKMEKYAEDPDQQFALGELYLYFHQYRKSIDCFKWEMELNPEDPEPIQYLSKVYTALGEKEEAKAYTMLLSQLNRKKV